MIIENGYKLDNSLIILALETLLEQVQDDIKWEKMNYISNNDVKSLKEWRTSKEKRIKKELFKIRNYDK